MVPVVPPAVSEGARRPLHEVHVGRQPIYSAAGALAAYELLFRHAAGATASIGFGAEATSHVITNALTEFGLDALVGPHRCFINLTREFLVGDLPLPFDPGRVVLEVLETVEVDDAVVAGVGELRRQGYAIALDDFAVGGLHEELLDHARYVKLDFSITPPAMLAETVPRLRARGLTLVAERLETADDVATAAMLGFDLLQGYALGRPATLSVASLDTVHLRRLELVATLSDEDVAIGQVAALLATDPGLTVRVLRASNAASSGLRQPVSTVHGAVMTLGLRRIRQLLMLMVVADLSNGTPEHLATMVTRARMCQIVAERLGTDGDSAFLVGLLASVVELVEEPPEALLAHLPLAAPVVAAITDRIGPLGAALRAVEEYAARHRAPRRVAGPVGVPATVGTTPGDGWIAQSHLAAIAWTNQVLALTE